MVALHSYDNLSPRRKALWRLVRGVIPRKVRWFYEGDPRLRGQLWYAERRLLYETVRKHRPSAVFEVGTWQGGGSTYFLAQALHDNGAGSLHTIEIDENFYSTAVSAYETHLTHLLPFVEFHLGNSMDVYPTILGALQYLPMVFLDGAQDAEQTFEEFEMFEPYLSTGSVVACHDWDNEKMAIVRPLIEKSDRFTIERRIGAPHSVGLAVSVHL